MWVMVASVSQLQKVKGSVKDNVKNVKSALKIKSETLTHTILLYVIVEL